MKTTGPPMRGGRGLVAALIFLIVGLLFTLFGVRVLRNNVDQQSEAILEDDAAGMTNTVAAGLERYTDVIHGAEGLFVGSEFGVVRREWKEYVDVQDIPERLPGIRILEFVEHVTDGQLDAFVRRVRADTTRDPSGYPTFQVIPPGSRPEYYVVNYLEPMEVNLAVFGYDAFSDPSQKTALERARDDGVPVIARQGDPGSASPGFALFVPLYHGPGTPATVAERRAYVEGMVSAVMDPEALFADLLAGTGEREGMLLDIEVHDGSRFNPESGTSLLYHRPGALPEGNASPRIRTDSVSFAGQDFTLIIKAHPRYGQSGTDTYLPIFAAIFGSVLPVAAFLTFIALNRGRQTALRLAAGAARQVQEKAHELSEANRRLGVDIQSRTVTLNQKVSELEGSKTAILNVLDDLTLAKEQLEAGQAQDRALLGSIADGVFAIDTRGIITEVNEAALRLLNRSREELIGKQFLTALALTDADGTAVPDEERPTTRALHGSAEQVFIDSDHYFDRAGEGRFPVTVDAAPIIMGGKLQGAVGVFRDTTKEKEVDRAKSEFVSLASHQLRTPLTSIGWYTELLLTEDAANLTPQQGAHLTEIVTANKRMVDLVDALLNVSRLELGTMTISLEQVAVRELVRRIVAQFAVQIAERNLRVDERYPDEEVLLMTDPRMFSIVVENLVSNGVKYSPPDSSITVTTATEGGMFILSVADKGIGIPQAQQSRLFTKLFRADNARLSDPEGNGLGLYLSKSIVDRMGGSITFTSKEGEGSTFTVRVPVAGPSQTPIPARGGGLEGKDNHPRK